MSRRNFLNLLPLVLAACSASAIAGSECDPRDNIPQPLLTTQTLALVDRSMAVVPRSKRLIDKVVAAAQPGQRLLVLGAARTSGTDEPTSIFDSLVPGIEDETLKEMLAVRPSNEIRSCLARELQSWHVKVRAEVWPALFLTHPPHQRHEIIQALINTLRNYAKPDLATRLMVYSDALQFGSQVHLQSLDKQSRKIDAEDELAKLPALMRNPELPPLGAVRVELSGLLMDNNIAGSKYHDAETMEQLQQFWTRLLQGWGVQQVQVDRELMKVKPEGSPPARPAPVEWVRVYMASPVPAGRR